MTDSDRLAAAPLLAHLHTRHPDVDIVVLPPEPEPAPRPVPVSATALDDEGVAVRVTLDALLDAVGAASPAGPGAEGADPTYRWHAATTRGAVVPVGQVRLPVADVDEATALAEGVAQAAAAAGWVGRWRVTGRSALLDAEHEGRSVRVARLDTVVLVSVTGRELAVSDATLRSLIGTEVAFRD